MPVPQVRGGQTASFSLKKIKRSQIRKGMVLVAQSLHPVACWEFEGEILVLHHPTTISSRYQAMVHCGSIRQTASILEMNKDCLRTGDKATVHFKFIKHPEYLNIGQRLVFREGRTKAVGSITKLIPMTVTTTGGGQGSKTKPIKNAPRYPQNVTSASSSSQGHTHAGSTTTSGRSNNENSVPMNMDANVTTGTIEVIQDDAQKKYRNRRGGRGRRSSGPSPGADSEPGQGQGRLSVTSLGRALNATTVTSTSTGPKPLAEQGNTKG
jgi:hypothetical protein